MKLIFLTLGICLIGVSSTFAFDSDVGKITKSEFAHELICDFAVATLTNVYESPVFIRPASVTEIPVINANVKSVKVCVHLRFRPRDGI